MHAVRLGDDHVNELTSTSQNCLNLQTSCGARVQAVCGGSTGLPPGDLNSPQGTGVLTGPRSEATLTIVSGDMLSDARVVAGMRPGAKMCFNQTLSQSPNTPDGSVTLTVSIAANGDVTGVATSNGSSPADDVACIVRRAQHAVFDASASTRKLVIKVDQRKAR